MTTEHRKCICPLDCHDTCGLLVQVDLGRIVRVAGDKEHPATKGFICQKVARYPDLLYGKNRVLYPMRRIGRKGAGEFERISWDEALGAISHRLRDIVGRYGAEAVFPFTSTGTLGKLNNGSMDIRFFNRLGSTIQKQGICADAGSAGLRYTVGAKLGPDPENIPHVGFIVLWGTNPHCTNIHELPLLYQALKNGSTLYVVDPRRIPISQKAHKHIMIKPGTDAAFALGLMHVILQEGLHDEAYIKASTAGIDQLRARVKTYSPGYVESITGVRAEDVVELARRYAQSTSSLLRVGYGVQHHTNGGMMVRCIACLTGLTGSWRSPGGGILYSTGDGFPLNYARLTRPDLRQQASRTIIQGRLGSALTEVSDPPIMALIVYNANPAVTIPRRQAVLKGLSREDLFTVVHEQVMTDTAMFADIVLPATTNFEHWDLHNSYWHYYLAVNRPVITPQGEARPNYDLFAALAKRMGFVEDCWDDSPQELISQALDSDHPRMRGITLEALLREGQVYLGTETRPWQPFADGVFETPTGKLEFYSATLAEEGIDPLPNYEPPAAVHGAVLSSTGSPRRYSLSFITPSRHDFLNSTFGSLEWSERNEGRPTVDISPLDADARSIRDGDLVRIFNERGETLYYARVTSDVMPGVLVAPGVWWARDDGLGQTNNICTDQDTDIGGSTGFNSNHVDVQLVG